MVFIVFGCSKDQGNSDLAIPDQVDFNFHIKPILVQKCYLCHGPDPSSREANLRLDTQEGAFAFSAEGQAAIVPGHPNKSNLIKRVSHQDSRERMPPPESNLELSEREVELLKKWIRDGAEYQPHWSFIPIKEVFQEKEIKNTEWGNEVDYFIRKKITEEGLQSVDKANPHQLIRRVAYVLTGLPPTPEQVQKFVQDKSADAYEKMVDSFLHSPAYGERWARHWMDVVRYAETKGHEFDFQINGAWRYRDYLIRAFNRDVPYDQLVMEHLAGDLIKEPRLDPDTGINESHLGTVFYALGEGTHSPVDVRKDESDRIDNQIDVITKGFQALTVSCAKCHDHKFDPIPTKDYYALYGIMESTRFSPVSADKVFKERIYLGEAVKIQTFIREKLAKDWSNGNRKDLPVQLTSQLDASTPELPEDIRVLGDFRTNDLDGWKSDGDAFGDFSTLGMPVWNQQTLLKLEEGKASSRYYKTGIFGALRSPDFILEKDFIGVKVLGKGGSIRIVMDNFQLISYPIYGGMDQKVNSEEWGQYIFDVGAWKGRKAYIEILPGSFKNHVYGQEKEDFIEVQFAIAYDKEWLDPPMPATAKNLSPQTAIENWKNRKATPEEMELLNQLIRENKLSKHSPEIHTVFQYYHTLLEGIQDSVFFNGVFDGFGMESPVFIRGNHQELSEEKVPRAFLSALPVKTKKIDSSGSGRMELAQAILDPDNPLTARVMVNRIWHHLFGRGIVETVDNFGLQGKLPTHPELLDYLGLKFQNEGWSIQKIIRLIVLSETFQNATQPNELLEQKDPENLLLARYPVRRLDAEAIRDGILLSSGNLNPEMYGPSVAVHLTDFMQGRGRPAVSGPMDGDGRRSIYLEVRRNFLDPMMMAFDRPTPFSTFGNRDVTNVPAQSLLLMNDPFVVQQAEIMARNLMTDNTRDIESRIQKIYLQAFSRNPDKGEMDQALGFIRDLAEAYDTPDSHIMGDLNIWKDYCHTVFNLKEFIYLI